MDGSLVCRENCVLIGLHEQLSTVVKESMQKMTTFPDLQRAVIKVLSSNECLLVACDSCFETISIQYWPPENQPCQQLGFPVCEGYKYLLPKGGW